VILTSDCRMRLANRAFYTVFRLTPEESVDRALFDLSSREWDIPKLRRLLKEVLANASSFDEVEIEHTFRALGRKVLSASGRKLDDSGVLLALEDITARKDWERRQEQLLSELSHRVKNTLAIAQAIAFQTATHVTSPEEFQEKFQGRLQALAAGHDLLFKSGWGPVELAALLEATLRPFGRAFTEGISINCKARRLRPEPAIALGLVFNELATNAAKYGALSAPEGRVGIDCTEDSNPGQLVITWSEKGGPKVSGPSHKGFGTRLIESAISHQLGGRIAFDYRPTGLQAKIHLPQSMFLT
jgi:two-component system CheB/CheR fusion protein